MAVRPRLTAHEWLIALAILLTAILTPLVFISTPYQLPLWIAAVFGLMGTSKRGMDRRMLVLGGVCGTVLVLFQFAQLQVPAVWLAADRISWSLGQVVGGLTGQPLEIGSTFAGLDFLVVMFALLIGSARYVRRPRLAILLFGGVWIVLGHTAYLTALAFTQQITERLPAVALPMHDNPYIPPAFCWSTILRQWLPWNLLALSALVHSLTALMIMRWTTWSDTPETPPAHRRGTPRSPRVQTALVAAPILLAMAVPMVGSLRTSASSLEGKRLLANQQEDIDYSVAQHGSYGQQSAGMFGLLSQFTQSLGGTLHTSAALTDEELRQTDVLLLLHPDPAWVRQHQRIWDYVRQGGSLLIVTSGFNPAFGLDDSCNELLRDTAITIRQDAAISETRDWQDAFAVATHAGMTTTDPHTARCWSDSGASLHITWGARPLVVGRWGWSAPQQGATWDESHPLASGERLGDLVLAAEQRLGSGKVVVLGSDASLLNEGLVKGYPFTGNLLAYLAHRHAGPHAAWRQWLGLASCLALAILLLRSSDATALIAVSLVLALFLAASQAISVHAARVVPDGQRIQQPTPATGGNRLAYIDQSHLEAYGLDDWGFDSLNGLCLNLMRNGFVPLTLPEFNAEQLEKAGMFVSIAPARPFSRGASAGSRVRRKRGHLHLHGGSRAGGGQQCTAGRLRHACSRVASSNRR